MPALTENVCVLIGPHRLQRAGALPILYSFIYLFLLELPSVSFACKLGLKHSLS